MSWYKETEVSWGEILDNTINKYPNRPFCYFNGKVTTYEELGVSIEQFANGLSDIGVKKGDRVAIWMTNCPEWVVAQFAIYRLGAILVPIYTYYKKLEVEYVLNNAECSVLIMKDSFLGKINSHKIFLSLFPGIEHQDKRNIYSVRLPALKTVITLDGKTSDGRYRWEEILLRNGRNDKPKKVSPFDVMNIMYTSGTTGFPKGGMSMHRTNAATVHLSTEICQVNEQSVISGHVPFFTNFGATFVVGWAIYRGAAIAIQEFFDVRKCLEDIEKYMVTHFEGTPSMYVMLMDDSFFHQINLSSLRLGLVSGSYCPSNLLKTISKNMNLGNNIVIGYGLSECGGLATLTPLNELFEKKEKSVGKALPSCQIKVVDLDTDRNLIGKSGEIWLKDIYPGTCVGKGYYNMPDKTKETMSEDGWFKTGDIGYLDEEGSLFYIGRLKDMFTVGGFNIYPAEIENILVKHPSVREAVVIGVPDPRLGEVPMAWVSLQEGKQLIETELIDWMKEKVSPQKIPRYVRFYCQDEIPITGSGKIQKFKLIELACTELGLSHSLKK
jgi:fatty-acyl-CoA synthase